MNKTRLEAFSDGVLAIMITIMVLELKAPTAITSEAIHPLLLTLFSYLLSFVFLGIYWGNHHHLLQTATHVNGNIIWANLHLLFWLSLIPFATSWMGESGFDSIPVAIYGFLLVACGIAYTILSKTIIASRRESSKLSEVLMRSDMKAKISTVLYISSIPLAFVHPLISCVIFAIVGILWIIPSKEIEKILNE